MTQLADILAMEEALVAQGGEKFELEDVDDQGEHTHVIIVEDRGYIFEMIENHSQVSGPYLQVFSLHGHKRKNFSALASYVDVVFEGRTKSWKDFPGHVALAKRLATLLGEDSYVAQTVRELES